MCSTVYLLFNNTARCLFTFLYILSASGLVSSRNQEAWSKRDTQTVHLITHYLKIPSQIFNI